MRSLPSFVPGDSESLPGDPVVIDLLPPVLQTDGPALVVGEAHVRVSLPLVDNGAACSSEEWAKRAILV